MQRSILTFALFAGLLGVASMLGAQTDDVLERGKEKAIENLIRETTRALTSHNPQIAALGREYAEGKNVVIGFVDGKPITSDQVKDELGGQLETKTSTLLSGIPVEQQEGEVRRLAEFQVVYGFAANRVFDEILVREAKSAGLQESSQRSQVDLLIESVKADNGIERNDTEAWAKFTLQNFAQTPLEFRKKQVQERLKALALSLMAGEHGPIKGLKLPLYLPLEVTPSAMRHEYELTKDTYRVQRDIAFSSLALEFPVSTSVSDRENLSMILKEARRRVASGEKLSEVAAEYLPRALKEAGLNNLPGLRLHLDEDVKAASDGDLDEVGELTRLVKVGEVSDVVALRRKIDNNDVDYAVFLSLKARTSEATRVYADPIVQRQIRNRLRSEQGIRNRDRVKNTLIDRAVLFPNNLLGATD